MASTGSLPVCEFWKRNRRKWRNTCVVLLGICFGCDPKVHMCLDYSVHQTERIFSNTVHLAFLPFQRGYRSCGTDLVVGFVIMCGKLEVRRGGRPSGILLEQVRKRGREAAVHLDVASGRLGGSCHRESNRSRISTQERKICSRAWEMKFGDIESSRKGTAEMCDTLRRSLLKKEQWKQRWEGQRRKTWECKYWRRWARQLQPELPWKNWLLR